LVRDVAWRADPGDVGQRHDPAQRVVLLPTDRARRDFAAGSRAGSTACRQSWAHPTLKILRHRNMTDLTSTLTTDNKFQIEFNFHQVPSALSLNIPAEAAALMLNITAAQFIAYTEEAFAECTRVAQGLLNRPGTVEAIRKLKTSRNGNVSTVMMVGDSITTYRYGYAEILRALLGLAVPELPVQVYNHGRSGYTSTHGLEHTFTQYLMQKPDW